jgi:hypothetical protein
VRPVALAAGARRALSQRPLRTTALALAALVCGVVALVAAAAAALVAGYMLWHAVDALAGGDADRAATWAALVGAAGAPCIVAYAAAAGCTMALRAVTAPALPRRRPRAITVAALGIGVVALAFQGVLSHRSYFAGDDWLHLVLGHHVAHVSGLVSGGLDIAYLDRPVFIHFAPGHRFGYWLLERFAPLDFGAALAAMLAMFAGCMVLLHLICVRLFGQRASNLVVLALFGTSILMLTSFLWFAEGLHKLPSTLLSLLAVHAYLRHRLDGSRAALALAVAAVWLGALFYVKVLLVPLYLVLIRLLFLEERPRRAVRLILRERWTWLAFVPPLAVYVWNYAANYASLSSERPPLSLLGDYLWIAWFRGATPSFGGVQVGLDADAAALAFAICAQVVLVALIVLSLRRKRSAWRAWTFWGITFLANATLVGLGRLSSYGLERVGNDLRYHTEMAWLLPLALAFAFFPGDLAGRPAPARAALSDRARRFRVVAVAAVAGAYLVTAAVSGTFISRDWRARESDPPKAYVQNLRADAARLGGARVMDDQVPGLLVASVDKPWNRLEYLMPAVEPRVQVVVADERPRLVRGDGHIVPAGLQPLGAPLRGTGTVELVRGKRSGRCLPDGGEVKYTTRAEFAGQSLYALVGYRGRGTGRGTIAPAAGVARAGSFDLAAPGEPTVLVNLGRDLRVSLPPGTGACLRGSAVGWLGG